MATLTSAIVMKQHLFEKIEFIILSYSNKIKQQ